MMPVLQTHSWLSKRHARDCDGEPIVIGLVNNMPDAALRTTERQFGALLSAASGDVLVSLRVFSLPGLARDEAGRAYVEQHHEAIDELWSSRLDGLIVTGNEPRAADLADEPYWPSLTKLSDWAEDQGISTVWSCLAAHAAVRHIDGIPRLARPEKLSGIFKCSKIADHAILRGTPACWRVPHSRHNDLPGEALAGAGYRILSHSAEVGPDMFVKQRKSLFVFLQGHPEFDPGALLREYRRDIRRYLLRERESYPEMPQGYFDKDTAAAFRAFRRCANADRRPDLLSSLPTVAEEKLPHVWRDLAVSIYANWLSYLTEQRARAGRSRNTVVPPLRVPAE